jgi:hypothetical protein
MLGGLGEDGHQRIEASIARALKQNSSCCLVLNQKEERMKLNIDMVVKGKTMNKQQIFGCIRDM